MSGSQPKRKSGHGSTIGDAKEMANCLRKPPSHTPNSSVSYSTSSRRRSSFISFSQMPKSQQRALLKEKEAERKQMESEKKRTARMEFIAKQAKLGRFEAQEKKIRAKLQYKAIAEERKRKDLVRETKAIKSKTRALLYEDMLDSEDSDDDLNPPPTPKALPPRKKPRGATQKVPKKASKPHMADTVASPTSSSVVSGTSSTKSRDSRNGNKDDRLYSPPRLPAAVAPNTGGYDLAAVMMGCTQPSSSRVPYYEYSP